MASVAWITPITPGSTPRTPASLQLEMGPVQDVAVQEPDGADAGGSRVDRGRGAEAARPDQEHLGAQELALPFLADLVEEKVAAVALDLLRGQRAVLDDRQAGLG